MDKKVKISGYTATGDLVSIQVHASEIYEALAELNGLAEMGYANEGPNNYSLAPTKIYKKREYSLSDELGYVLTELGFQRRELKGDSPWLGYTYEKVGNKFLAHVINILMDPMVSVERVLHEMPRGEILRIVEDNRTYYINIEHGACMYIEHGTKVIKMADSSTLSLKEDITMLAKARFNQKYL